MFPLFPSRLHPYFVQCQFATKTPSRYRHGFVICPHYCAGMVCQWEHLDRCQARRRPHQLTNLRRRFQRREAYRPVRRGPWPPGRKVLDRNDHHRRRGKRDWSAHAPRECSCGPSRACGSARPECRCSADTSADARHLFPLMVVLVGGAARQTRWAKLILGL